MNDEYCSQKKCINRFYSLWEVTGTKRNIIIGKVEYLVQLGSVNVTVFYKMNNDLFQNH